MATSTSGGKTVVPAYGVRCHTCGGHSTLVGKTNPDGSTWKCPHHGDNDSDGALFSESGVGTIGHDFSIVSFEVLPKDTADRLDASYSLRSQLSESGLQNVKYADFRAVVVRGETAVQRASERGVTPSAVRSAVKRAKDDFGGGRV